MDGHFDISETSERNNNISPTMQSAVKFLGGHKQWTGTVNGLGGLLKRQFKISSQGQIINGVLTFDETMEFNDGETQDRHWRLFDTPNGLAVEGSDISLVKHGYFNGEVLHIIYRIKFGVMTFNYRDSFKIGPNGQVLNIGYASILGLTIMKIEAHTL